MELSVCGTDCSTCYCYGEMCNGCFACEGKVFHAPEGKVCPIYDCVRNQKGLKSCGACGAVPCQIWRNTRDPKFGDEEFEQNMRERIACLQQHAEI